MIEAILKIGLPIIKVMLCIDLVLLVVTFDVSSWICHLLYV